MDLQVGDKVRVVVTRPECGWGKVKENSIGVITEINSSYILVDFPEQCHWQGYENELLSIDHEIRKRTHYFKDMSGVIDLKPVSKIFNKEVKKC